MAGSQDELKKHMRIFPMMTTYIVFYIDPVATLESLEDPVATVAAEKLASQNQKYVGYVRDFGSWIDEAQAFQSFRIQLLRQGLPLESQTDFQQSEMCVPVLPNTYHPTSRESLRPERPLPWPNCYHSSFDDVEIRVRTQRADMRSALVLPIDEIGKHIEVMGMDVFRQSELKEAHNSARACADPSIPELSKPPDNDDKTSASPSNPNLPSTSEDEDFYDPDDMMAEFDAARPSDTMPLAIVSYDLTTAQEPLPDPASLYKEIHLIEQLLDESNARASERKARAIELARQRDEEAYGNVPKPEPRASLEPELTHELASKSKRMSARVVGPSDQERPSSKWTRPISSLRLYFDERPFWGVPVDPPPAIVTGLKRWGVKLRDIAKRCTCGMLGPVEEPLLRLRQATDKQAAEPARLDEKTPRNDRSDQSVPQMSSPIEEEAHHAEQSQSYVGEPNIDGKTILKVAGQTVSNT